MLSACTVSKGVIGLLLGLLWRAEPALQAAHLSPFPEAAGALATGYPFNGGTGFFVSEDGVFVSAHHVLGTCAHPAVQTPDGLFVGERLATSAQDDVTVIKTGYHPEQAAAFPLFAARGWGPVMIARMRGCGGLASRSLVYGRAAPAGGLGFGHAIIQSEEPIVGGNSGSPVIDESGEVVGMLVARAQEESRIGVAVDDTRIIRLLRSAGIEPKSASAGLPLSPAYHALRAAAYTFPALCLR
jgi:serine protease Do